MENGSNIFRLVPARDAANRRSTAIPDPYRRAASGLRQVLAWFACLRCIGSRLWLWRGGDGLRALADLDEDQVCNLSEFGRRMRLEARMARAAISSRRFESGEEIARPKEKRRTRLRTADEREVIKTTSSTHKG
jgi:hypothetical protein